MSISDYERRKLLEKAAKLKAEKEGGSSSPSPLNKQQVQDRKMDQRLEQTQAAAKATAQATSKFAKELAANTAKLAQAKVDAWKQAQHAKRAKKEEVKQIESAKPDQVEPNPAIENTPVVHTKALSKPTFKMLASIAAFTALSGAGAWFWTQHESEKTPELHQVAVHSTLPVAPAPQVQEGPKASEPVQVIEPVQTPIVEELPKSVEPKPQKVEGSPAPNAVVRAPKKRSELRQQAEQPNAKKNDWVDKANNDLDHFAEHLK